MKVVINACYGGFSLSKEAMKRYCEIKGIPCYIEEDRKYSSLGIWTCWVVPPEDRVANREDEFYSMSMDERKAYNQAYSDQTICDRKIVRNDPALVQVVEEMKHRSGGRCAELKVVEIPDDVEFQIEEYDGYEHVAEVHRTWS